MNFKQLVFSLAAIFFTTSASAEDKTLKIYNWSDYIEPSVIAQFEKETGIKVIYDTFDNTEIVEAKLTAGKSGYDLVVVTATFLPRLSPLNIFTKLDKSKLPNLQNAWPEINARLATFDFGNQYSVNYMWGTTGIGYNADKVKERLGVSEIDSWSFVFDPEKLMKLSDCGVHILDATDELFPAALNYLGKNPITRDMDDLRKAADLLYNMRPYVSKYHSSEYINALANGDICLAVGYSGDILQAKKRAEEVAEKTKSKPVQIHYSIPKEGSLMWFDNFVIPQDATNPEAAYAFINFVNKPEIAAKNSSFIRYASGNIAAQKFIDWGILKDKGIFPDRKTMDHLFTALPHDLRTQTTINRMWTNIKARKKPY